jgi:hypothetical protein
LKENAMNKRDLIFLGAGMLAGRATRKKTAPGIGGIKYVIKYEVDGVKRKAIANSAKERDAIIKAMKSGRWRENYNVLKVSKLN